MKKYSFKNLADKIVAAFNWEANGFKLNDYEVEFEDRICFVSGVLQDGKAVIYSVIESFEDEETEEITPNGLINLMDLINKQL